MQACPRSVSKAPGAALIAPQGMWLPGMLRTGSGSAGNSEAGVAWGVTADLWD